MGCFGLLIWSPVLIILGIVWLFAEIGMRLDDIAVHLKMQKRGRVISRAELKQKSETATGTLIIESTTIGWGWGRLWWTEDDIRALSPTRLPTWEQDEEVSQDENVARYLFTKWTHEHYTDLKTGKAYLVKWQSGSKKPLHLAKQFSNLKQVDVWSGGLELMECRAYPEKWENGDDTARE